MPQDEPGSLSDGVRAVREPVGLSGWLLGIVLGVLAGLLAFPAVRYTAAAQLQLAFVEDGVAWIRALDARHIEAERPRLDRTAAEFPNDYLIQVGRATVLADTASVARSPNGHIDTDDKTLWRLARVVNDFPNSPGVYAHLARYMTAYRIHVNREELRAQPISRSILGSTMDPNSQTASPSAADLRVMLGALRAGELRDPDNAFWPTLQAVTYFAAGPRYDNQALGALYRAAHSTRWDSFIYEQVLGEWRLYAASYGDNGATQKIGPLSLVAFPHLREIRRMAEMARFRSNQEAARGNYRTAIRIRQNLGHLGLLMENNAHWSLEAIFGTDLYLISAEDGDTPSGPTAIRNPQEWRAQAGKYLALLQRLKKTGEIRWLETQVDQICRFRARIDVARNETSYPGAQPGIPLGPLFSDWMTGICLIQQVLALIISMVLLRTAFAYFEQSGARRARQTLLIILLAAIATALVSGTMLFFGVPNARVAAAFLTGVTLVALFLVQGVVSLWVRLRAHTKDRVRPWSYAPLLEQNQERWSRSTTAIVGLCLFVPALFALRQMRPILAGLHPVAVLLSHLMGSAPTVTVSDAVIRALLAGSLPLALLPVGALWALLRKEPPLAGAYVGARKMLLPCMVFVAVTYLFTLSHTLRTDVNASKAINKVAENDLQWVLTHTDPNIAP